jgi:peptide/nickel transport system substrate-binding protein
MKWRRNTTGTAVAAVLACLVAVGASGQETTAAPDAAAAIEYGGTLTVALETDLRDQDYLHAQNNSVVDRLVLGSTVYDPLFQSDEHGGSIPALAVSAEPSADAKTWTIKLREGVTYQDGRPFTAQDVKLTIDAYLDPANASATAGSLRNIASVTVKDDYTVEIALKNPDGRLPASFTETVFILDMVNYNPDHPNGTGPYAWDRRVVGDRLVFKRYENHWRGRPPLDEVVFRVIPDAQVAALELQGGDVDIIPTNVSVDALPAMREDPNVRIYESEGSTFYEAYLNFEKARRGGYADPLAFRQGLAYLWNSEQLVPAIIGDYGTVARDVTPPWQEGANTSLESWPYDPEKGKALLAQGGYPEGSTINVVAQDRPHLCDLATAFSSQLTQLGYVANLSCLAPEAFFPVATQYEWDILFTRVSGRASAAQNFRDRWTSGLVADPPADMWTYRGDKVDQLVDQMQQTTDPAEYQEIGQQLSQTILKDDVVVLPAYWDRVRIAARANVMGVKVSPLVYNGILMNQMSTVWLDQ